MFVTFDAHASDELAGPFLKRNFMKWEEIGSTSNDGNIRAAYSCNGTFIDVRTA